MKYGQDFVSIVSLLAMCLGAVLLTYGALRWLQWLDRDASAIRKCSITVQGCLCMLGCEAVYGFYQLRPDRTVMILLSVLTGCLLAACIMDLESCMVYNYVWWAGGLVGAVFLYLGNGGALRELVIYILLQELLFSRVYGRADCHAFAVCAAAQAAFGMTMQAYLVHMLLAFVLLAVIQGISHNIGRNGNLKQSVAFLPYITASFWMVLFLYV